MANLVWIGLQLTVFGMGLVFLLLGALWGLMGLLVRLDRGPAEPEEAPAGKLPAGLEPEALTAITLAVAIHRDVCRKQAAPAMRSHQPGTLPSRWLSNGRARQNLNWHPKRR